MKSKILLILLAVIMILVFIMPANGDFNRIELETVDQEYRTADDHPWGGEDDGDDPNGGSIDRITPHPWSSYGPSFILLDIIRIVWPTESGDYDFNKGVLPEDYGNHNTWSDNQKGQ